MKACFLLPLLLIASAAHAQVPSRYRFEIRATVRGQTSEIASQMMSTRINAVRWKGTNEEDGTSMLKPPMVVRGVISLETHDSGGRHFIRLRVDSLATSGGPGIGLSAEPLPELLRSQFREAAGSVLVAEQREFGDLRIINHSIPSSLLGQVIELASLLTVPVPSRVQSGKEWVDTLAPTRWDALETVAAGGQLSYREVAPTTVRSEFANDTLRSTTSNATTTDFGPGVFINSFRSVNQQLFVYSRDRKVREVRQQVLLVQEEMDTPYGRALVTITDTFLSALGGRP